MKSVIMVFVMLSVVSCAGAPTDADIQSIKASSFLKTGTINYGPERIADKLWYPWIEGKDNDGIGESVTFTFKRKVVLKEFTIRNGYGLNRYFKDNNRVKTLVVSSETGTHTEVNFDDDNSFRKIILPEKVKGTKITFTIKDIYKGTRYRDTCIAEIVFGDIPVDQSPLPIHSKYAKGERLYGYVRPLQGTVTDMLFSSAQFFSDGMAAVSTGDWKNLKFGYIDETGQQAIPLKYNSVENFHEERALVQWKKGDDFKSGYIDKTGALIFTIPYELDYSITDPVLSADFSFHEGKAVIWVHKEGTFGTMISDPDGKYVYVDKQFGFPVSEGLIRCHNRDGSENIRTRYLDASGKVALELPYSYTGDFHNGYARVKKDSKNGFVDKKGMIVIPLQNVFAQDFSEGFSLVRENETYYFINTHGEKVFGRTFADAQSFSEGLAAVKIDGKWGFIDTAGAIVIPVAYSYAYSFFNGFASVMTGKLRNEGCCCHAYYFSDENGYINRKGQFVWEEKYL